MSLMSQLLLLTLITATAIAGEPVASVYTKFPDDPAKRCKVLEQGSNQDPPPDYVKAECPGYQKYRVRYSTDGDHGSILALFHSGTRQESSLTTIPTIEEGVLCPQGFTWVTAKQLEWRVEKNVPFALIYRVNCEGLSRETPTVTEILAVASVSPIRSCLIGRVIATGNPEANNQARTLADTKARSIKCPAVP